MLSESIPTHAAPPATARRSSGGRNPSAAVEDLSRLRVEVAVAESETVADLQGVDGLGGEGEDRLSLAGPLQEERPTVGGLPLGLVPEFVLEAADLLGLQFGQRGKPGPAFHGKAHGVEAAQHGGQGAGDLGLAGEIGRASCRERVSSPV